MRERRPFYMTKFRCIGGDCPDTCCRDWEVVLDEESAAFYRTVPGELGDLLRASMTELDGEPCFYLKDGLCPLLNAQGLCRIQLELGEERLSRSCDLHPRFAEEYGSLREWVVSMACPEAARLLLSDPAPVAFVEEQTDEPVSPAATIWTRVSFSLWCLCGRRPMVLYRTGPWTGRPGRPGFCPWRKPTSGIWTSTVWPGWTV